MGSVTTSARQGTWNRSLRAQGPSEFQEPRWPLVFQAAPGLQGTRHQHCSVFEKPTLSTTPPDAEFSNSLS